MCEPSRAFAYLLQPLTTPQELTGTDLSSTALRPFFEADVCEGEEQVVHRYYVADYSACGPRVLSFAGAQRASVGLQATPCLVSVRELLHGLEGCEDVLRLAGEALRVLLVEKAAAQMLRYLEAASRGGRFPSKKKRRKIETQGGQAMVVTETLAAACGTPLALLDALQHPTLAPSGTLPRRVVARYLLCADPTLDNEALHALLTPLGLHHAEETRYVFGTHIFFFVQKHLQVQRESDAVRGVPRLAWQYGRGECEHSKGKQQCRYVCRGATTHRAGRAS